MDLQRLEKIAQSAANRQELEQLLQNVRERGSLEAQQLVFNVLNARFPVQKRSSGGATSTEAMFRGRQEIFDSGKDAYIWLVEQFRSFESDIFAKYEELIAGRTRAKGRRFAPSIGELFPPGSSRGDTASNYAALSGSWFADVNMDHKDKFLTLMTLARSCGLRYPVDFEFRPIGGTEDLRMHQEAVVRAQEFLDRLGKARPASAA